MNALSSPPFVYDGTPADATFRGRRESSAAFRWQLRTKRAFDVVGSLALLVASAPVVLAGIVLTVATSPGNPFFSGLRFGVRGTSFKCWKLRTMRFDQAAILAKHGLEERGGEGRLLLHDRDPRFTPVGPILRKLSIDELPQLFNVLRGEMSLVGPRPLALSMLEGYDELRDGRGAIRPGITGLWQVRHRMKNASVLDMVDDDAEYVATLSLPLDAQILLRTIPRLLEPAVAKRAAS